MPEPVTVVPQGGFIRKFMARTQTRRTARMLRACWLLALVAGAGLCAGDARTAAAERITIGIAERVFIYPGGLELIAKIDTGAEVSSLNARDLQTLRRDGRRYARFTVVNRRGESVRLERRIVRRTRIKRTGDAASDVRPVVRLGLCLADVFREIEVSLADREGFDYQMLVGVDVLAGRFVVDPAIEMTRPPSCPRPSGP